MKLLKPIAPPALLFLFLLFGSHFVLASFDDVNSSHENSDAIKYMQSNNIVQGYSDGTFKPDQTINRAEFTKIIMGAVTGKVSTDGNCFSDVKNEWFAPYICTAKSSNIISGYADGSFKPGQQINFAEASKIIVNAFKYSVGSDAVWYKPFVSALEEKNAIPTTINNFSKNITRGEMAEMIYRLKADVTTKASSTYAALAGEPSAAGLIIDQISSAASLKPMETLKVSGTGFDTQAAASAIFTTVSGEVRVIPATSITSTSIEVQIPPVGYETTKNAFTRQKVSISVIQIKEQGERLAVTTSNEITGFYISAPVVPSLLTEAGMQDLPTGTIARSFLSVSLYSLKSLDSKLSTENANLSASLIKAQDGLNELITAMGTIIDNPKAVVKLNTTEGGTVSINVSVAAKLDAIYSAYLVIAEKNQMFVSGKEPFAFLPTAYAAESLGICINEANSMPGLSDEEKRINAAYCTQRDNALDYISLKMLENKIDKFGEAYVKFIDGIAGTLGGMWLAAEDTGMQLASQISLASILPLDMEMSEASESGKTSMTDALGRAIDDQLLTDGPIMEQIGYMAEAFVDTGKYMYGRFTNPENYPLAEYLMLMAEPFYNMPNGFNPDIRLINFTPDTTKTDTPVTVRQIGMLPSTMSLILDPTGILNGGFDVIPNPTPTPPPSPAPTPDPEPDVVECTEPALDTYHVCTSQCDSLDDLLEKSNCINTCIGNWLHSDCP